MANPTMDPVCTCLHVSQAFLKYNSTELVFSEDL